LIVLFHQSSTSNGYFVVVIPTFLSFFTRYIFFMIDLMMSAFGGNSATMNASSSFDSVDNDAIRLTGLPVDVLQKMASFLTLEEIHKSIRPICSSLKQVCDNHPKWIPIIAPPSLANSILSLRLHGKHFRYLYIRHYIRWYDQWRGFRDVSDAKVLRRCGSEWDGYFSLAPWRKTNTPSSSYPTPWLHQMVYRKPCPTTAMLFSPRKKPRLNTKTTNNIRTPSKKSSFFQQRHRAENSRFRTFYTMCIEPDEWRIDSKGDSLPKHVIIQPINFRTENGNIVEGLPDHDEERLSKWNSACMKLVQCYFGESRSFLQPTLVQRTNLTNRSGLCNCRRDTQRLRDDRGGTVIQINARALSGMGHHVVRHVNSKTGSTMELNPNDCLVTYVVAPHLYASTHPKLPWLYSVPVSDTITYDPWVLSTFKLKDSVAGEKQQLRTYAVRLLYSIFAGPLALCENSHCMMNNCDSTEEASSTSLIPCPACIRKLQLGGILGEDIPRFLCKLHGVLSQEPFFVSTCGEDIRKLEEYGVSPNKNKRRTPMVPLD
jgi:hypothetical protein